MAGSSRGSTRSTPPSRRTEPLNVRSDESERFAEAVLSLVERIPAGRVMSYGAIARAIGGGSGPRRVGRVLSIDGGGVPWWRVVRADGTPYSDDAAEAYDRERTPLREGGRLRVDMARAAWSPRS